MTINLLKSARAWALPTSQSVVPSALRGLAMGGLLCLAIIGDVSSAIAQPHAPALDALSAQGAAAVHASAVADAATKPAAAPEAVPQIVRKMMDPGDKVLRSFDPKIPGLGRGYVIQQTSAQGNPTVVYVMADGLRAIVGAIVEQDAQGEAYSLTRQHLQRYALGQPDQAPEAKPMSETAKAWFDGPQPEDSVAARLQRSGYIAEGPTENPRAIIYAFFDPHCIYCNMGFQLARPYVAAGLQIRWVPINVLREDGVQKIAGLWAASNPSRAFVEAESHWSREASAFPIGAVNESIERRLEDNFALFKDLDLSGTPAFVYLDGEGRARAFSGLQSKRIYSIMSGLEYQAVDPSNEQLATIPD